MLVVDEALSYGLKVTLADKGPLTNLIEQYG